VVERRFPVRVVIRCGAAEILKTAMTMVVEITRGSLLPDLIDAFTRCGCLANRIAPGACRVVHPHARDRDEARLEIAFFLRAWQLRHPGVEATIA
jgi:hypothetical protein